MKPSCLLCTFILLATLLSCKKSDDPVIEPAGFSSVPQHIAITGGELPEASGIADSKANPGYLWVEEDSGNPADIYLLDHNGQWAKTIPIEFAENRDWEDIALGAGPDDGKNYLYLGDIGDNDLTAEEYRFYRFEEPLMSADKVTGCQIIRFVYPDGPHDAEAFLVDPVTKDILVITKRDDHSKIYKLPYPQDTVNQNSAVFVSDLDFNGVVSAAMSPDAKELIVKTYTALYHYSREAAEPVTTTLGHTPAMLGYELEEQGEAITFARDNTGFYTLSETRNNAAATLDFYKRN